MNVIIKMLALYVLLFVVGFFFIAEPKMTIVAIGGLATLIVPVIWTAAAIKYLKKG